MIFILHISKVNTTYNIGKLIYLFLIGTTGTPA